MADLPKASESTTARFKKSGYRATAATSQIFADDKITLPSIMGFERGKDIRRKKKRLKVERENEIL